jgi:hypothetical protein
LTIIHSHCRMCCIIEAVFQSAMEASGSDTNSVAVPLMTRIDFVYGLVKVALRSADDAVRNVRPTSTM